MEPTVSYHLNVYTNMQNNVKSISIRFFMQKMYVISHKVHKAVMFNHRFSVKGS